MSRSMAEQRRQNVDSGEIAHIGPSGETPEAVDSAPVSGRSAAASGVDDTGHAGLGRSRRTNRGTLARARRVEGPQSPLPERSPRHRPRSRARRHRRVRRGQGAKGRQFRRPDRGGELAEAHRAHSIGTSLDRPPRQDGRGVSIRRRRGNRRRRPSSHPARPGRLRARRGTLKMQAPKLAIRTRSSYFVRYIGSTSAAGRFQPAIATVWTRNREDFEKWQRLVFRKTRRKR